eukprot:TRINITY_DN858_c0_g1_i1.p2 TRINITY_DN858_c0_g1~~TRINITY_DN858_c0_g1_i1.p2  ORF type:complete len:514 (-),score=131.63 TRINITY_DN858_c0_g1_i1:774-2315(-)
MKEELEQKLASLNQNVTILSGSPKKDIVEKVMSKEEKQKLEAELEKKQKEATEFIHKLKAEKQERKKKEEERRKMLEQKMRKESEELNKKLKEREEELLKKRKERNMEAFEKLKKQRENDQKKIDEAKSKAVLHTKDEYLYKKLEDKYNKEVLMPMLEKKKEELAKKRNLFKPVNREELEEHMKKYELVMAQKEEVRQKELKARKEEEQNIQSAIKKLKTPALERQSIEELKLKEELEKKKLQKVEWRKKIESYGNLLKDICPVKVSESKAEQLKKQIEQLKHPVRQSRDTRKLYELANLNKRSLKDHSGSHSMDKLRKDHTETNISSAKLVDRATDAAKAGRYSAKEKNKSGLKSAIIEQELQKAAEQQMKAKKLDYLAELRKKREEHYGSSKPVKYDWTNDLKDQKLNPSEKYNRLVGKANLIEEQAKMKEKLLQAKGGTERNPEMGEYVSDMFIDAIKAKLAILENLQSYFCYDLQHRSMAQSQQSIIIAINLIKPLKEVPFLLYSSPLF